MIPRRLPSAAAAVATAFLGHNRSLAPTLAIAHHNHHYHHHHPRRQLHAAPAMRSPPPPAAAIPVPTTTTTTSTPGGLPDGFVGSVKPYDQHLLIVEDNGDADAKWTKTHVEDSPFAAAFSKTASLVSKVKVTIGASADSAESAGSSSSSSSTSSSSSSSSSSPAPTASDSARRDVLLFPNMVRIRQVAPEDAEKLAIIVARGKVKGGLAPATVQPLPVDYLQGETHVVVCTHNAVDCRCGEHGTTVYKAFVDEIEKRGLAASVKVHKSTHVGGHAFAANAIIYPSGDWYGNLRAADVPALLDAAVAAGGGSTTSPRVHWPRWRGRHTLTAAAQTRAAAARQLPQFVTVAMVLDDGRRVGEVEAELFDNPAPGADGVGGVGPYRDGGSSKSDVTASLLGGERRGAASASASTAAAVREGSGGGDGDDGGAATVGIAFVLPDGTKKEYRVPEGVKLMEFAKKHELPTIEGVCDGHLECATCHVIVDKEHFDRLKPASDAEEDMLEYAVGRQDLSRLSCQLIADASTMEGMVLTLPGKSN
ncbi:Sucrase/ferredoxin-like-domain-containing protein [Zopfochytrium polystomum]|nr:Sucrase/ferredoxin-like-domain-containing protein [Zopfochytrium polystomum]